MKHRIEPRRAAPATQPTRAPLAPTLGQDASRFDLTASPGDAAISTIMSRDFAVVRDSLEVDQLVDYFLQTGVTSAAVSDEHGALMGCVSMVDVVRERHINGETDQVRLDFVTRGGRESGQRTGVRRVSQLSCVRDIMMPFVLRLEEDATIDEAAAVMALERVHRLLVVSRTNEAVGTISALDVLRWLAERDGYKVPASSEAAKLRALCEYATGHGSNDNGEGESLV